MSKIRIVVAAAAACALANFARGAHGAAEPDPLKEVYLGGAPSVSPDGSFFLFDWCEKIWKADLTSLSGEAVAKPLTSGATCDFSPRISPDGSKVAFLSAADYGGDRIFVFDIDNPSNRRRVTDTTLPTVLCGWTPDGKALATAAMRAFPRRKLSTRPVIVSLEPGAEETVLFDAGVKSVAISPDSKKAVFAVTLDETQRVRRGTRSSCAGKIWLYHRDTGSFELAVETDDDCREPVWLPDSDSFIYARTLNGVRNLFFHRISDGFDTPVTSFDKYNCCLLSVSADGRTAVYRNGLSYCRTSIPPDNPAAASTVVLKIHPEGGVPVPQTIRHKLSTATNFDDSGDVAFTPEADEIAFTSGGALWAMDTVARLPAKIHGEPLSFCRECAFSPDAKSLYWIADRGDGSEVWVATKADAKTPWWECGNPEKRLLASDSGRRSCFGVSPDGRFLSWLDSSDRLTIASAETARPLAILPGPVGGYAWHPSSQGVAFSRRDEFCNSDIWIARLPEPGADESAGPAEVPIDKCVNVSRHYKKDFCAAFSPDGRLLAFLGERSDAKNKNVFYAYLDESEERSDNKMFKKLQEARKKIAGKPDKDGADKKNDSKEAKENATAAKAKDFVLDSAIHKRVRRLRTDALFGTIAFSPDSHSILYKGTQKIRAFDIVKKEEKKIREMSSADTRIAGWAAKKNAILTVAKGLPCIDGEKMAFEVHVEHRSDDWYELAFRTAWGALRDNYNDPGFHGADWCSVRDDLVRYARCAPRPAVFSRVVALMNGALDSSHMGFTLSEKARSGWGALPSSGSGGWKEETLHTGAELQRREDGAWIVKSLVEGSPLESLPEHPSPGDEILEVDSTKVRGLVNEAQFATVPPKHTFRISYTDGKETNTVYAAGMQYDDVREKARDAEIEKRAEYVHEKSGG